MRLSYKYPRDDRFSVERILPITDRFEYSSVLLSNMYGDDKYSSYESIIALGALNVLESNDDSFQKLRSFHKKNKDWMFGFMSYDLKNEIEDMSSQNIDNFNIPNLLFYIPETVILISADIVTIESTLSKKEIEELFTSTQDFNSTKSDIETPISLQFRETKKEYLRKIKDIKSHIQNGDIYEMNYCQELYNEGSIINPRMIFKRLNNISKAPFSSFFHYKDNYLICGSPERFLKKQGDKIISQPIKGTKRRGINDIEDEEMISQLKSSQKDISENVMIADLVRNDLSKTAKKSSVQVEELCGIYSFNNLHHMITTITSLLDKDYDFVDVLKGTFPMGSMTGAPKIKAMELIERYETTKRSLFSSAFGYITPETDFDFNVVIRSILHNVTTLHTSVMVGGAITINSDEMDEYDESLLKAKSIIKVLDHAE